MISKDKLHNRTTKQTGLVRGRHIYGNVSLGYVRREEQFIADGRNIRRSNGVRVLKPPVFMCV